MNNSFLKILNFTFIFYILCFETYGQNDTIHINSKFYLLNTPVEKSLYEVKYDTVVQNKDTIVIENTFFNNVLLNRKKFNHTRQLIEEKLFLSDSIYLETEIKYNKIKVVYYRCNDREIIFSWDDNNYSKGMLDRSTKLNEGFMYDKDTILDSFSESIDTTVSGYIHKDFYQNGRVFNLYYGLTRISPFYKFHKNGKLAMSGFINGMEVNQIGQWKWWNDKGVLIREQYFNDTIPNLKEGTWKWWDDNGKLIKEETYKNDVLIDKKEYVKSTQPK